MEKSVQHAMTNKDKTTSLALLQQTIYITVIKGTLTGTLTAILKH